MKLLLLNPNTSESITRRIAAAAADSAAPQTELIPVTAPRGVPYIATLSEALIGGAVALEMLAELHDQADAAVIAAFGDPGLAGARELCSIPVVGLAEAGMLTACMLGRSFGIVAITAAMLPFYEECVRWHGLAGRCAGIRALEGVVGSVATVQDEREEELVDLAHRAVSEDRADVIILAGAPLAGLSARVRERIPVPLVECVGAAVKQAEALVKLNPRKPLAGTFRRPSAKGSVGLPERLTAWLAQDGGAREPIDA